MHMACIYVPRTLTRDYCNYHEKLIVVLMYVDFQMVCLVPVDSVYIWENGRGYNHKHYNVRTYCDKLHCLFHIM